MDAPTFARAKFITQTHRNIHERRKVQEFKVVITTVTFHVAATAAILTGKLSLSKVCIVITCIAFALLAIAACLYFIPTGRANRINQKHIYQPAEDLILKSLGIEPPKKNPLWFAYIWQCSVVVISAVVASIILLSLSSPKCLC